MKVRFASDLDLPSLSFPVVQALPDAIRERLKKKKELKGCSVTVEKVGNAWRIAAVTAPE